MLVKGDFKRILFEYPMLELILQGGVVSNKLVRNILQIDRYSMEKLQQSLFACGAVIGVSSTAYRATDDALEFIRSYKNDT